MCVFGPKSRSLVSAPPAVVLLFFTLVPVTIGQTSQVGIAVDSKGNVGIKTSSPTAVLDVNGRIRARKGADATSGVEYFDAADKIGFFAGLDTDGSWRLFGYKNRVGNAFVITESGSVTIGKASAPGDLSLKGNLYMDNHCCPVKSRIESIGWGHRGIRLGSRMAGVPVKGAFFRIA